MKKAVFIIPYYGNLPCYFPAWLISAKKQRNIDFLLISDLIDEDMISDSNNIKLMNWTFDRTFKFIQSKFDFKINIDRPYKFCDFKPAYGYIFEDYIKDYEFWGHCDIDIIMGDLYKFLEQPMKNYDAIGRWGHLSLYRNTPEINSLFMSDKGLYYYKIVYSNNYSYCFDETPGMKMILKNSPSIKTNWDLRYMVDCSTANKYLIGAHGFKNFDGQIFFYHRGKLYHAFVMNNEIKYREIVYLHFQRKNPIVNNNIGDSFYIFYDEFIPRIDKDQDELMIKRMKKYQHHFYMKSERIINYWIKRFINLIRMDKEQRRINNKKRRLHISGD